MPTDAKDQQSTHRSRTISQPRAETQFPLRSGSHGTEITKMNLKLNVDDVAAADTMVEIDESDMNEYEYGSEGEGKCKCECESGMHQYQYQHQHQQEDEHQIEHANDLSRGNVEEVEMIENLEANSDDNATLVPIVSAEELRSPDTSALSPTNHNGKPKCLERMKERKRNRDYMAEMIYRRSLDQGRLNLYKVSLYPITDLAIELINKVVDDYLDSRIQCNYCCTKLDKNCVEKRSVSCACSNCYGYEFICDDCSDKAYIWPDNLHLCKECDAEGCLCVWS